MGYEQAIGDSGKEKLPFDRKKPRAEPGSEKTVLILHGTDNSNVLKTFLRDFSCVDVTASHSGCRVVGCTSTNQPPLSVASHRCSFGLRSADC